MLLNLHQGKYESKVVKIIWAFFKKIFDYLQGNGAVQKGLPFKAYHGKTGRVFNVTPHAVGVIVNKRVWYVYLVHLQTQLNVNFTKHSFMFPKHFSVFSGVC